MAEQATARKHEPQTAPQVTGRAPAPLLGSTALQSGSVKAANDANYLAPAANDANYFRPPHSYTQSTLAPTSEFTRYVLLALPARYLFRSVFESLFHNENAYDRFQRPINDWIDKHRVNKLAQEIDKAIAEHPIPEHLKASVIGAQHRENAVEHMREFLTKEEAGKALQSKVTAILDKNGSLAKYASGHSILPYALTRTDAHNALAPQITTKSRVLLRNAMRSNYGHIGYGLALGAGALALSVSYSYNVYQDMKHLFTETVGYEFDKKPEDVTIFDIFRSNNHIVNATSHNFWMKLLERVGLSVPFFFVGKALPMGLADFTIGMTGARLLQETWNRKPTMFEDLVTFVNQRINPQNGLGQPITVADIFDIYQHYCYYNQKDKGFHNVISTNNEEARGWGESQILFARMAELMNKSYAYKHTTQYDSHGNVLQLASFTLPKFVYLLGNGLIDAKHPGKSLAYVEIANTEGMAGVKKAQAEFAAGATIDAVHTTHHLPPSPIKSMRDSFAAADLHDAQADSLVIKPPAKPEAQIAAQVATHDGTVQEAQRHIQ